MAIPDLFAAIQQGDLASLEAALADRPDAADARNEAGLGAVVFALYYRRPDFAVKIAAARQTPLDLAEAAALGESNRVAEVLAATPGAVAERTADGFTALHYAAFFDHSEVARGLLDAGADPAAIADNPLRVQPLHSAVAARSLAVAALLLAHGADANARQQAGFTPLQGAAEAGRRDLAELLLAHGARREDRSDDGRTAADVARAKGHEELAAFLA